MIKHKIDMCLFKNECTSAFNNRFATVNTQQSDVYKYSHFIWHLCHQITEIEIRKRIFFLINKYTMNNSTVFFKFIFAFFFLFFIAMN